MEHHHEPFTVVDGRDGEEALRTCKIRSWGNAGGHGVIAAILFSTSPVSAACDNGFSGRWRADTSSFSDVKPTVLLLSHGVFKKDNDGAVKADGAFHAVSGQGGYTDETSISVVGDHFVKEVDRVGGRIVYTVDYSLSPDGQRLTTHVRSFANASGKPSESETVERRVGRPDPNAHQVSGTWQRVTLSVDSTSDWIIRSGGSRFSRRSPLGSGYDAIIGKGPVRYDGDVSGARVLISRPRRDTVVERWMSSQGVFGAVLKMQVMSGGKKIRAIAFAPGEKKETTFYLHKVSFDEAR